MTSIAYFGAALFYIGSAWLGIQAFGPACKSYMLNNLSPKDPLGVVARGSIALSILASTPLMFINMRNWLISLAKKRIPIISGVKPMAATLVFLIAALASRLTDISVLASIAGGVLGTNLMFTLPSIMYIRALSKHSAANNTPLPKRVIAVNILLFICGGMLAAIGTYKSVSVIFKPL